MKKIYSFAKQATVAVAICLSLFSTQAFGQTPICGPIVENFNNTGGGTAGFTGGMQFGSTGTNGYLQKTNVNNLDVISIVTPTYQLANNVNTIGLGFTLAGLAVVGDIQVSISYISTTPGLGLVTKTFGTPPFSYTGGSTDQSATICNAAGTSTYADFPVGGSYRFNIQLTVVKGNVVNGALSGNLTFDDFRTTGTRAAITLPVAFISFDANKTSNGIQLNWRTAGQENVNHYDVERSNDGRNFTSISSVAMSKTNVYSYLDPTAGGTTYYRIKNVDNDGKFKYTNIVRVLNGKSSVMVNAFPQPALSQLTVQHPTISGNALFTLSAADGRTINTIRPVSGSMQTMVDVSKLQSGLYLLRFDDGTGNVETMKVIKQ